MRVIKTEEKIVITSPANKEKIVIASPANSIGPPGKDAYQIALLEGFEGTRTEWINAQNEAVAAAEEAATARFAVRVTLNPAPGDNVEFILDSASYTLNMADNIVMSAVLPSQADLNEFDYHAIVDILAPSSGSASAVIPSAWIKAGDLSTINMIAGDPPMVMVLRTMQDGTV